METISARIFARKLDNHIFARKLDKKYWNCCDIDIVYVSNILKYDITIFKQSCHSLAKIAVAVAVDQMSAKSCHFFKYLRICENMGDLPDRTQPLPFHISVGYMGGGLARQFPKPTCTFKK